MADKRTTRKIDPYRTRDGSIIREIFHPQNSAAAHQSLAEARVPPGEETLSHAHRRSEEIYYVLQGVDRLRVGKEAVDVAAGDGVLLPPGVRHSIRNIGGDELVFLCMCSPPYSHDDTELT